MNLTVPIAQPAALRIYRECGARAAKQQQPHIDLYQWPITQHNARGLNVRANK